MANEEKHYQDGLGNKLTMLEMVYLSSEMWTYLRDNPEIKIKGDLPATIWHRIRVMYNLCPLCVVFPCYACPLDLCDKNTSHYKLWCRAEDPADRRYHAGEIVKRIEAWIQAHS